MNLAIIRQVLDHVNEGIYFVDLNRRIFYWNKTAETLTGFKEADVSGCYCYNNILNHVDESGCELCDESCPLNHSMEDGNINEAQVYLQHKSGERIKVKVKSVPIVEDGVIIGAAEYFSKVINDEENDIIELKAMAYKDQLTNLYNRRYIDQKLIELMNQFKAIGTEFAIALIDIDYFKSFNDQYGHNVGDEMLIMTSKVFSNAMRGSDFIGRWGGEEFIAVLSNIDENDLFKVMDRIRMLIEKSSLRKYDPPLKATISIGATCVYQEDKLEDMFKRADLALYTSKKNGRNLVTVL